MPNVRLLLGLILAGLVILAFAQGRWQVWPIAFLSAFPAISTSWSSRRSRRVNLWMMAGFCILVAAGIYMQSAAPVGGYLPKLGFVALGATFLGILLMRIGRRS